VWKSLQITKDAVFGFGDGQQSTPPTSYIGKLHLNKIFRFFFPILNGYDSFLGERLNLKITELKVKSSTFVGPNFQTILGKSICLEVTLVDRVYLRFINSTVLLLMFFFSRVLLLMLNCVIR
jgi:hypothetical protein